MKPRWLVLMACSAVLAVSVWTRSSQRHSPPEPAA